ncbi:hypothetical protein GCM10011583_64510 [Streptomyces camponoticapitis]|uniref:Uncharacterized protein n=1 Tax=Streptomyces camponoticapitis TaxID=1616125 RepID=A0ABQ2EVE6_9ACTN|nr:hypothetical protein [Streptomyces camponoticapitis]GGK23672.1 hypothetical protein GCM10011583_64510 [Streptomyces camponoticapitis]
MFFQSLDGVPLEAIIAVAVTAVLLTLARVVKNLPREAISKFIEHRTTKYQIIASDSKGRMATMQKQRFVFLGFALVCVVVIVLALISSTNSEAEAPKHNPAPRATTANG